MLRERYWHDPCCNDSAKPLERSRAVYSILYIIGAIVVIFLVLRLVGII